MKYEDNNAKTMQCFNKEYLRENKGNEIDRIRVRLTTVKIFTVGQGLLANKHLPRLSKKVKIYGAETVVNNIHTQRSR